MECGCISWIKLCSRFMYFVLECSFLWIVWNAIICKVLGHYKLLLECLEVRVTQIEQMWYLLWWKMLETAVVLQFRVWIALPLLLLNFVGNVWYVNLQSNLFSLLTLRHSSRRQLHIVLIHACTTAKFHSLSRLGQVTKNGYLVTKRGWEEFKMLLLPSQ